MMIRIQYLTIVIALAAFVSACQPLTTSTAAEQTLSLATTTSTQDSGLLDAILPDFTTQSGVSVDVIAVGTGQALKLGEDGNADVLLVHARSREDAFMQAGHGSRREDVMYNDFVILGPAGDPADIAATDRAVLEEFPENESLARWIRLAGERVAFQGLPARICWLGYGERHRLGLRFNEMVKSGELKAPIVIGRDHLDSGSVASPYRETEGMADGSDAIADWPLLNGLVNTCSGATWVSLHHGGGVGMGFSQHAGMVIVADGTEDAARRLERVLWNDPGTGVMRHADAGYEEAIECARDKGLKLPAILGN